MSDDTKIEDQVTPDPPAEESAGNKPDYPEFDGMGEKPSGGSQTAAGDETLGGMELLRDVDMEVTVELGRTRMNIGEIMELGQGSVVELDKMAGEPVDIRINGILMATGEVIVLDDVCGVRITRLVQRVDRLQTFS